jgi:hypothetical protein
MRTNSLTIDYLPLKDVRPYPGGVRHHNRAQLRKLGKLIERFGQLPIIVIRITLSSTDTQSTPSCATLGWTRSRSSSRPAA